MVNGCQNLGPLKTNFLATLFTVVVYPPPPSEKNGFPPLGKAEIFSEGVVRVWAFQLYLTTPSEKMALTPLGKVEIFSEGGWVHNYGNTAPRIK